VLLDDVGPADDDEPVDGLLPLSEDLLSAPLLLLAAGAAAGAPLDDEPRLSVR
jgi:hypothetical protein